MEEKDRPIYEVILFYIAEEDMEVLYQLPSGLVVTGYPVTAGFWYSREDALKAMWEYSTTLWDNYYNCAYLYCREPGLSKVGAETERTFFLYDESSGHYTAREEPWILKREWRG